MQDWIGEKIIGTWKLVSWKYKNEKGEKHHFFGKQPKGILMYDVHGYMNAQLMRKGRKSFASRALTSGSMNEKSDAFLSYFAYYGRYEETGPGQIVHIVEGSLMPNWVKDKQIRYVKIEKDILSITTPPILSGDANIIHRIKWKRMN